MSNIEIVDSLRSLYPLKDFEEEAIMEVVSEFRELKEKATEKKSRWKYFHKEDIAVCENCSNEHFLGTKRQYATRFCPNCGSEMEN